MDGENARVARHEAVHACAALSFGWPVRSVFRFDPRLSRDGALHGVTFTGPRTDGDIRERGVQAGVVVLAPFFEDTRGCDGDIRRLDEITRAGVSLSEVWDRAAALVSDPAFRRRVRRLEDALWNHPFLSGEEVELLLAT